MNALRRTLRAPAAVVLVLAVGLAPALGAGGLSAAVANSAMGPFSTLDDGHLLGYVVELAGAQPALPAAAGLAALVAPGLAALLLFVLTGGIVAALAGRGDFGRSTVTALPALAVQGLYHAVLRAVFLVLVFLAAAPAPKAVAWPILALAYLLSVHAYDLTRVRACTATRRFHPRLAFEAYRDVLTRRPGATALAVGLGVLGWGLAALAGYLTLAAGTWTGPAGRVVAGAGLLVGLVRLAVAVGRVQAPSEADSPPSDDSP